MQRHHKGTAPRRTEEELQRLHRRLLRRHKWKMWWRPLGSRAKAIGSFLGQARQVRILVLLVLVAAASALSSWALRGQGDWQGFALNLGTELFGAVITYLLLEQLIGRRRQREEDLQRLKVEMGSSVVMWPSPQSTS